jgi:hypothetical protein
MAEATNAHVTLAAGIAGVHSVVLFNLYERSVTESPTLALILAAAVAAFGMLFGSLGLAVCIEPNVPKRYAAYITLSAVALGSLIGLWLAPLVFALLSTQPASRI